MHLIPLLVLLVVAGVALFFVEQLPMDANVKVVIRVAVVLFCLLLLLQAFGLVSGPNVKL